MEINKLSNEYEKLLPLLNEKETLEEKLLLKMERWEYLTNLHNKISEL